METLQHCHIETCTEREIRLPVSLLFSSMFISFKKKPIFGGALCLVSGSSLRFLLSQPVGFWLCPCACAHIAGVSWYFGVTIDAFVTTLGWGEVGHPEYRSRQGLFCSLGAKVLFLVMNLLGQADHSHLVPRLRMYSSILPFPQTP